MPPPLTLTHLLSQYRDGSLTPTQLVQSLLPKIDSDDPKIWIHRIPGDTLLQQAAELESNHDPSLPLYGIPFAVKDNIDVAGLPTTAACPEFEYIAETNAHVVQRLLDAGALLIGKTNMDQFATGLVGTRSPYGVPGNAFNPDYIPGGSSSGSAVAVAKGLVSFALGTDTAGSGRVPASFNNLIGFKPTRGRVSCRGVVPACKSLDCVSIFALQCADAHQVWEEVANFDVDDPFSRMEPESSYHIRSSIPRVAVPPDSQLEFFGDSRAQDAYQTSLDLLKTSGAEIDVVDMTPFYDAARLLYEGPWVAERYLATSPFIERSPDALWPETGKIISGGKSPSALDAFNAQYKLAGYVRKAEEMWSSFDFLMLPTTGTIYTQEAVAEDPIKLNTNLGYYTNFMNLMDLCGCAVPTAFRDDGLPSGTTLFAPAFMDGQVLKFADKLHSLARTGAGLARDFTPTPLPNAKPAGTIDIFVCGAHMQGLPLNWQLTNLGATFLAEVETAPVYKMVVLPPSAPLPERPGMVRTEEETQKLPGELWRLPTQNFGEFLQKIKYPLGISEVLLADGSTKYGFSCDAQARTDSQDITHHGGWRSYLASK